MMDYFELIEQRESCRSYDGNRPVEKDKLLRCLDAARLAPSACNSQPWHFYAVTEPERLCALRKAVQAWGGNVFADQCPVLVTVTEETAKLSRRMTALVDSQHFAAMDVGLASAQFCLAATAQGLSTCILGSFDEDAVKAATGLAPDCHVRLVLALGYAADDTHREKKRLSLDEMSTLYE